MKVAQYLKAHGVADYWQVPIAGYIIDKIRERYLYTWQEYMTKY